MSKVWAFVDLVNRFDAAAVVTARQVADWYEVDIRTAQRWLCEIEREWGLKRMHLGSDEIVWRKAR